MKMRRNGGMGRKKRRDRVYGVIVRDALGHCGRLVIEGGVS